MRPLSLRPVRIALLIIGFIFSLHLLASFIHEEYRRVTSISHIVSKLSPNKSTHMGTAFPNDQIYSEKRVNATFVILCRNDQLWDTIRSVREIEDRFNHMYHYPYVFLNEAPFTEDFKYRLSTVVSSKAEFGLIPRDHWFQPDWIDEEKAKKSRDKMQSENIIYGGAQLMKLEQFTRALNYTTGSLSYRNMCRFNSGFFFRHPLMQKYKWYWRIEPDVHFHCDIFFDPFRYMEEQNKIYAFTISMTEYEATIPTLWDHVRDFIQENPQHVAKNNYMGFISDDAGKKYNLCHFWSNFEIANMEFWRGEAYMKFFEYLDSKGGFYYERWGDAPVHSIAAAIFASRDQIHFFDEIGYEHDPYTHCPKERDHWKRGRCSCNPRNNFDFDGISCLNKYVKFIHT